MTNQGLHPVTSRPACRGTAPAALLFLILVATRGSAADYFVGPDLALKQIGAVPWESLEPGDHVYIQWRPEPYREKWVICRKGTANAPITISGVPSVSGQLPVIDGDRATTCPNLDTWGENRNIIKIPADTMPAYITIENLDIRNARPPFTYTDSAGKPQAYITTTAGLRVEKGEHIVIRNCTVHDCGNGLMVSSSPKEASRDILIEGNHIFGNGNEGSEYEHNVYTAAIGIIFQKNRFGPQRPGCNGSNIKDRSAGTVIRYNWIEGGNKEIDLVDGQDSELIRNSPDYHQSFVYGNMLIEPYNDGQPSILKYGGDSRKVQDYRKGTLYFYNNTVVSLRTDRTILFQLLTDEEHCECANNVIFAKESAAFGFSMIRDRGSVTMSHNWVSRGWVHSLFKVSAVNEAEGPEVSGDLPGFVDLKAGNYHLGAESPCRSLGTPLKGPAYDAHPVDREYVEHCFTKPRSDQTAPAAGAFALKSGGAAQ